MGDLTARGSHPCLLSIKPHRRRSREECTAELRDSNHGSLEVSFDNHGAAGIRGAGDRNSWRGGVVGPRLRSERHRRARVRCRSGWGGVARKQQRGRAAGARSAPRRAIPGPGDRRRAHRSPLGPDPVAGHREAPRLPGDPPRAAAQRARRRRRLRSHRERALAPDAAPVAGPGPHHARLHERPDRRASCASAKEPSNFTSPRSSTRPASRAARCSSRAFICSDRHSDRRGRRRRRRSKTTTRRIAQPAFGAPGAPRAPEGVVG